MILTLLVVTIVPIGLMEYGSTSEGVPSGTPISTPQELQDIVVNDPTAQYYLANDIFFGTEDLNGGIDIGILAVFDGTKGMTVTLTLPAGISIVMGSAGVNSQMVGFNNSTATATFNDVMLGNYTLMIGGTLSNGDTFALARLSNFVAGPSDPSDPAYPYHTILNTTFNSNGNFTPIGTASTPFKGTLDGNGHAIYGMNSAVFDMTLAVSGLFAYAQGATIINLGNVLDRNGAGWSFAASMEESYSGGIVGVSLGSTIRNCYNSIYVSAADNGSTDMGSAGGIIGTDSTGTTGTPSIIEDNWNGGRVVGLTANGRNVAGGGIIGCSRFSSIRGCNNSGAIFAVANVPGTGSDAIFVGGIAGYVNPLISSFQISDSFNTGVITGKSTYRDIRVGGIVGFFETDNAVMASPAIVRCYNSGTLDNQFYYLTGSNGSTQVGGIVGEINSTSHGGRPAPLIQQCYNTGNIKANSQFNIFSGGIVGEVDYASCRIFDCYNTGLMTSTGTGAANMRATGGIVGLASVYARNVILSNCYNNGTLDATGPATTKGGMIGLNNAPADNTGTSFFNCYSLDTVSALLFDGGANNPLRDQGTATPARGTNQASGRYTSTLMTQPTLANAQANTNSIYYTGTMTGTGLGAIGLATITGWNFNTTWTIDKNINGGYPTLRAFVQMVSLDANTESTVSDMNIFIGSNYYSQTDPQYPQYQLVGGRVTFWVEPTLNPDMGQTPQYQWQISTDGGSTWNPILGAVGQSFTLAPVIGTDSGTMYRAAVTSPGLSGSEISEPNTLYVLATVTANGTGLTRDTGFEPIGETDPDPEVLVYWDIPSLPIILTTAAGNDVPTDVVVTMGGAILDPTSDYTYDMAGGEVSLLIPTDGDIVITAVYTVTSDILHVEPDPETAEYDSKPTITINEDTGYALPSEIIVTMAGSVVAASDYTYDDSTGEIVFGVPVTGNIVISTAPCTVTYDANGGDTSSVPPQATDLLFNDTYTLSSTEPTHADVSGSPVLFMGWTLTQIAGVL
ncbi:MAG: hypothetical protein FWC52_04020, partial [Candidatus Methanoplasma sp.]|nr:hypothetical protein [Candidatus Methanoplasma sp.]